MADTKTTGLGTKLVKIKSGSETENLTVAHLKSIGEVGLESDELDVSDLDSTSGFRDYIRGAFKDAGEVPFAGDIVDESLVETLMSLADAGSNEEWEVQFPSGAKWAFKAFIKSFKTNEVNIDDPLGFSASLRISGKPTFTPATTS
jgi:predicted secreted protein